MRGYGRRRMAVPPPVLYHADPACISGVRGTRYFCTGRLITGEMVAEASLNSIRLAGQLPSSVENLVTAHQVCGRPVIVIDTETEFDERLESYERIRG